MPGLGLGRQDDGALNGQVDRQKYERDPMMRRPVRSSSPLRRDGFWIVPLYGPSALHRVVQIAQARSER